MGNLNDYEMQQDDVGMDYTEFWQCTGLKDRGIFAKILDVQSENPLDSKPNTLSGEKRTQMHTKNNTKSRNQFCPRTFHKNLKFQILS